ncbi:flavanone 3-dioxygenase 2-like [Silene latifolia]|uniref:flavanone 3-dioxygenase 2-like n=1 Tax=Silene latifolia TaxID=37657 RepID=UPI003D786A4B
MLYTSSYAHALGMAEPPLYWRDALQLNLNTEIIADGWPTMPHSFQPNVLEFATSVELLEKRLLRIISEGLGLHENYFDGGLCQAPHIIVNSYPKCPEPTWAMGMPMHCDPGVLTISLLGDVPGTQIYENGEWFRVVPDMNSLLVTVGHQLQVISNGAFKAPIHRETVNSDRARITISRVSEPAGDYVVGPARELITTTNPPKYKSFKYEEYLEHHFLHYKNTCLILERYYMSS